jgi:hypothetical protein
MLTAIAQAGPECCHRVLADPAVRGAINAAVAHFKLHSHEHLDEPEAVLAVASDYLEADRSRSPLEDPQSVRLGPAAHHGWIWNEERAADPVGHYYRHLLHRYVSTVSLQSASSEQRRMLVEGTALLDALLPKLAASALTHLHVVAVATHNAGLGDDVRTRQSRLISLIEYYCAGFTSLTQIHMLGTIFLDPCVLKNPWQVAEFVLHEALHHKFIDLEHTHSLLRRGYQEPESPKIPVPWNRSRPGMPNEWAMNRCMTVMHVYVGLAIYFSALVEPPVALVERYGPPHVRDPLFSAQRAADRARYLAAQMKQHGTEMGPAGHRFVDWMVGILDDLNLAEPAAESTLHLLLDLYERETFEIEEWLAVATEPLHPGVSKLTSEVVHAELVQLAEIYASLGEVLPAFGAVPPLDATATPAQLVAVLRTVRAYVSAALKQLDPCARVSGDGPPPAEQVRQLVESSGVRLNQLVHRLA